MLHAGMTRSLRNMSDAAHDIQFEQPDAAIVEVAAQNLQSYCIAITIVCQWIPGMRAQVTYRLSVASQTVEYWPCPRSDSAVYRPPAKVSPVLTGRKPGGPSVVGDEGSDLDAVLVEGVDDENPLVFLKRLRAVLNQPIGE